MKNILIPISEAEIKELDDLANMACIWLESFKQEFRYSDDFPMYRNKILILCNLIDKWNKKNEEDNNRNWVTIDAEHKKE